MSNKTIKARFQVKNDTSENWHIASEKGFIPLKGEFIYYTNTKILKLGDGVNTPDDLDVYSGEQSDWGEMDEAAGSFVKNRTHYIGESVTVEPGEYDITNEETELPIYLQHDNCLTPGLYKYIVDEGEDGYRQGQTILIEPIQELMFDNSPGYYLFFETGGVLSTNCTSIIYTPLKQLDADCVPYDNETIINDNGKLKASLTAAQIGAVAGKANTSGDSAIPFMAKNSSTIAGYKIYTANATPGTVVYRTSSSDPNIDGRFNVLTATSSQHPVPKAQMESYAVPKNTNAQTVYITDPTGDPGSKTYTSEQVPSTIVHREPSLNTFAVADPIYNGHPVTLRYAKERYFPIQTTNEKKPFATIRYATDDESDIPHSKIDELIAGVCELGQKIYSLDIVNEFGFSHQTVATIIADENGNKIVNSYTSVGMGEEAAIYARSPFLQVMDAQAMFWAFFRAPNGHWYISEKYTSPEELDNNGIPLDAQLFASKEIYLDLYDPADHYEHATSSVLIQDPSGNPSYKKYSSGPIEWWEDNTYNHIYNSFDWHDGKCSEGSIGEVATVNNSAKGTAVVFNRNGYFNVPNPQGYGNPINKGWADDRYVRMESSIVPEGDSGDYYVPVLIRDINGTQLRYDGNEAQWVEAISGPDSSAEDGKIGGKLVRFAEANSRFNVLDPIGDLHPVNKQTLKAETANCLRNNEENLDIVADKGISLSTYPSYVNITEDGISFGTSNDGGVSASFSMHADNQGSRIAFGTTYDTSAEYRSNMMVLNSTNGLEVTGDILLNNVSVKSKLESITGVMHFLGKALVMPTTNSVTLSTGEVKIAQAGDIILYESKEFIWDGIEWSELGDVTDYVTKTVYDAKVLELTNANTALENRIKALEDAIAAIGTLTITESDNTLTVQ